MVYARGTRRREFEGSCLLPLNALKVERFYHKAMLYGEVKPHANLDRFDQLRVPTPFTQLVHNYFELYRLVARSLARTHARSLTFSLA